MSVLDSVELFGVRVHRLTMTQAVQTVESFLRDREPRQIVTADTSMLVMAQHDAELRRIINQAALVTPDSFGVTWAARRLKRPVIERVTGVDLMAQVCARCADNGWRPFLFGSAPGVADEAAERLSARFPGLSVAGTQHGYFGPEDEEQIVAQVAASKADILFVAMGIPKQEKWIARYLPRLGVSAAVGVGGSLDVFSGRVKRAPLWTQRCNVEWLYRLCSNPRKINKVKMLPVLVLMTYLALLRGEHRASR